MASAFRVRFEALHERGRALAVTGDDQDGVVPGNGPDGFGELSPVERFGQRLSLPAPRPEDDELLDALDTVEKLGSGALEHRAGQLGAGRLEARPLVRTVTGALDEAEVSDVARDGGLRGVEALLMEAAPDLLLAVERLEVDKFEDDGLASCFHHAEDTSRIHDLRC
jgi:hypothetical protein